MSIYKLAIALGLSSVLIGCAPTTAPDYDRDEFGPAWYDVDKNGCDTRNDVLSRQLQQVETKSGCRVISGKLIDPYTGKSVGLQDGIEVDHVVALSDAWYSGASKWTFVQRVRFANDPENLNATARNVNRAKGAKIPGEWLPVINICNYINQYINVKAKYDLKIDNSVIALRQDKEC